MIDFKNLLSTLPPGPPPTATATPPAPAPVMLVEPVSHPIAPAPEPPLPPSETTLTAPTAEISAGEAPQNQTEPVHPGKTPDIQPQEPVTEPTEEQAEKKKGGTRPGAGRPRKGTKGTFKAPVIVSSNLPAEADGLDLTEIHENAFDVIEGLDNVDAVMAANAPALVTDAYKRAARAGTSKDPLDRVTYLALLAKATPQAKRQVAKQTDPASAKAELAILNRILAGESIEDVQFTERERTQPDAQDVEVVE